MIIIVLIIFFISYLLFKYPNIFGYNQYTTSRYVVLTKDKDYNSFPISFSNIVFLDANGEVITPYNVDIYPSIKNGDGITPQSSNNDPKDIILIETGDDDVPHIEYDLGDNYKLNKIIITGRVPTEYNSSKLVDNHLLDTKIEIYNSAGEIVFTSILDDVKQVYSINTY